MLTYSDKGKKKKWEETQDYFQDKYNNITLDTPFFKKETTQSTVPSGTTPPNMGPAIAKDSKPIVQYGNYYIDPNTDYKALQIEAEKNGDYNLAAYYERMRNAKIDAGYGGVYQKTYDLNYNNQYADQIADLRDQYANFREFEYDPLEDENYLALSRVYNKNAGKASADAMARASAANGGRVSSGVASAMTNAYMDKMSQLEAQIPALQQAAYNMYMNEKNDLRTRMGDLMNQEAIDYSRWSDNYQRRYGQSNDLYNRQRTDAQDVMTAKLNEAQLRSIEASIESGKFNDALNEANQMGYVTPSLSAITGLAEGTPMASTTQYWNNLRASVLSDVGKYSPEFVESIGLMASDAGNTVSRDSMLADTAVANRKIDAEISGSGYGGYPTGGATFGAPPETSGYTIDDARAAYESGDVDTFAMVLDMLGDEERDKLLQEYGLTNTY